MVTKKTVFVLGAGASMDFGFPSGIQLVKNICEKLSEPLSGEFDIVQELGFDSNEINKFTKALKQSGRMSVDAFLEGRIDFIGIGKAAITACLVPYENPDKLTDLGLKGNNWYEYLFDQMSAPINEIHENKIGFITYNYDRSLECFFEMALRNSYNATSEQVQQFFNHIPIVHLHGQLGEYAFLDIPYEHDSRRFSPDFNIPELRAASAIIKIIHEEDINNQLQFKQAWKLLQDAEQIAFLGFGFHPKNIERLKLECCKINAQFYGTACGMKLNEQMKIRKQFRGKISLHNFKILGFLRESGIIASERDEIQFPI